MCVFDPDILWGKPKLLYIISLLDCHIKLKKIEKNIKSSFLYVLCILCKTNLNPFPIQYINVIKSVECNKIQISKNIGKTTICIFFYIKSEIYKIC